MTNSAVEERDRPARQEAVLDEMRKGKTLPQACTTAKVCHGTAATWIERDTDGFKKRYIEAKRVRGYLWAEMGVDFADDCDGDSSSQVAKAKLRGDVRWRLVQRDLRDEYGEDEKKGEPTPPTQIVFPNYSGPMPELPKPGGDEAENAQEGAE